MATQDSAEEKTTSQHPVRVLLLHNFVTPTRFHLFKELAGRFDFEVWFLGDIRAIREWPNDVPEGAFRYRLLPHHAIPLGSRYNMLLWNRGLLRELECYGPDAIIGCGWDTPAVFRAAAWARRRGVPFILWSGSTARETNWLRSMTTPLVRRLVRRADAWLAYGSRAEEYLLSLGANPVRTFRAYNTIETREFAEACAHAGPAADELRERLQIATPYVALYCGNVLELKGVGDLLEAFKLFTETRNDVTLVLVGKGKDEGRYRAYCAQHGLNGLVRFAGFVPRGEVPTYYRLADVLVLPSRSEVWGLVINEALACGVPVIASDAAGATADLITHGVNGLVVPPQDPAALLEALLRFFDENSERDAMTEAAQPSVAPYSIAAAAEAFVSAILNVLPGIGQRADI